VGTGKDELPTRPDPRNTRVKLMGDMKTVSEKRAEFRRLHEAGCFVIPNPWDVGSARYLESMGFSAVATTSSGFAFSQGFADNASIGMEPVLRHAAELAASLSIPVNVDFQDGYAADADGVAESVRRCVETGVAGLSIEDNTNDFDSPLYEISEAVERLIAARESIAKHAPGTVLTARSECYLVGHPDPFRESLRRLEAYAEAGADVFFVPGPATREEIKTIVELVAPKPVNVIVTAAVRMTVPELAELGVRRISVGSALARAAWTGFLTAARQIAEEGSFESFGDLVTFKELNGFFGALPRL